MPASFPKGSSHTNAVGLWGDSEPQQQESPGADTELPPGKSPSHSCASRLLGEVLRLLLVLPRQLPGREVPAEEPGMMVLRCQPWGKRTAGSQGGGRPSPETEAPPVATTREPRIDLVKSESSGTFAPFYDLPCRSCQVNPCGC